MTEATLGGMRNMAGGTTPGGFAPQDGPLDTIDIKRDRLVIIASSLGSLFEWYDFFVYGTLAVLIGHLFFPSANPTAGLLLSLATFGVGFGVRPVGAVLFGWLGDKFGRKHTFLITISLMGFATAALGFLPTYNDCKSMGLAGITAPISLVILRALQGLALGGEYGGAAIYVAEHAPRHKRGFYTSFIQASIGGGFTLSLIVVLTSGVFMTPLQWVAWGWRIPFILSLLLLILSLWIRLKLTESPVFRAMKAAGETAHNPLRESLNSPRKVSRLFAAMIGIASGLTVIWYTVQFSAYYFLQNALRLDETSTRLLVGAGVISAMTSSIFIGWLSDKIGRKGSILLGYVLTLCLLFPLFHMMANAANPQLAEAVRKNPIEVTGDQCNYNPFLQNGQSTPCGRLLDIFSKLGLPYSVDHIAAGTAPTATIGAVYVDATDAVALQSALKTAGYLTGKSVPSTAQLWAIGLAMVFLGILSGMTFGPVAAYLVELFPARVRYTSLSMSYHVGTGYFGGFLPFINQYIGAKTGDPFSGLWYTLGVVFVALIVLMIGLPETSGKELD